ncbi:hypothetical protein KVR01_013535 [Diaporthe batatas]|uniref:uncharacterized protein n=1 Tax=Diaporthe batatas TaxID=748121 RepID=UPI001D036370|nr:uncharacterized protein KVR01_013535 [Diaporthe batatas]KAG8156584.1 hypothetical protein KVR01_013535 [Diaporthe batatas]
MPSLSRLPDAFQASYLERESYPRNLAINGAARDYVKILENASEKLFQDTTLDVRFRDLLKNDGNSEDLDKKYIQTEAALSQHLGVRVIPDPTDIHKKTVVGSLKDPKCRFVYIYGEHSRARLRISRSMLLELLTWHQIAPAYVDFMLVFGMKPDSSDLLFGGFRAQVRIKPMDATGSIAPLGRSGRHYELCYNLKGVSKSQQDDSYSIRQSAFYHRFDVVGGNALWIVTKGGDDLHHRFKELTSKDSARQMFADSGACFRSSLAAHMAFCYWSTEDWHGYIRYLETMVGEYTIMALLGHRGEGNPQETYTGRNIQQLQIWRETVCDVIAVLDSNVEVISSMAAFYRNLQSKKNFPLRDICHEDIDDFVEELHMIISSFKLQISRAESLRQRTMERSELVKQHVANQTSERLEKMNQQMEREAIAVRIITIVTLIYLPATFVSTFFSTDIIKYQGDDGPGSGTFSATAMIRWLQVTLPLTLVTLLAARALQTRATSQVITASDPSANNAENAITTSESSANNAEKGIQGNWYTRPRLGVWDIPLRSWFTGFRARRKHSSAAHIV